MPLEVNITLTTAHNSTWQNANFWRDATGRSAIFACFWSQVNRVKAKAADCWLWQGRVDAEGYGVFRNGLHCIRAHKFTWLVTRYELPLGRTLRHVCGNRRCVNPSHLRLVHQSTSQPVHRKQTA